MIGVTITIPGDPSGARINTARRATVVKHGKHKGKPTTYKATKAARWSAAAVYIVRAEWGKVGRVIGAPLQPLEGPRVVEIATYWPRRRRTGPAKGQPLGDVDATEKAVLDVLQDAGVLANDGQVWRLVLEAHYDKARPRIEVRL